MEYVSLYRISIFLLSLQCRFKTKWFTEATLSGGGGMPKNTSTDSVTPLGSEENADSHKKSTSSHSLRSRNADYGRSMIGSTMATIRKHCKRRIRLIRTVSLNATWWRYSFSTGSEEASWFWLLLGTEMFGFDEVRKGDGGLSFVRKGGFLVLGENFITACNSRCWLQAQLMREHSMPWPLHSGNFR